MNCTQIFLITITILVLIQSTLYKVLNPSTYELLEKLQFEFDEKSSNQTTNLLIIEKFNKLSSNFTAIELLLVYKVKFVYMFAKQFIIELINVVEKCQQYMKETWEILVRDIPTKSKFINKKYVHNFASLYGGAIILEKSSFMQNVDNVLQDNKDNYLLTDCSEPSQYIIISLKEEIEFQTLMMINQELFASTTQNFQLFGSLIYPAEEWNFIGNYTAQNINDWQVFQVQPHFVRYVKIFFQSYYQDEHFCIITQIKIFGQTVIADLIQSNKRIIVMPSIESETQHLNQEQTQKILEEDNQVIRSSLITELLDMEKVEEARQKFNLYTQEQEKLRRDNVQLNFTIQKPEQSCSYIDYVKYNLTYNFKPKLDQFIEILPYFNNQSIFKVTAQNMLILSHNHDVLKKVVLQLQRAFIDYRVNQQQDHRRIFKDFKVLNEAQKDQVTSEHRNILKLQKQLEESRLYFFMLLALVSLTIIFSVVILFIVLKKCQLLQQKNEEQIYLLTNLQPPKKDKRQLMRKKSQTLNSQTALIQPLKALSLFKKSKKPQSFRELQSVSNSDIESALDDLSDLVAKSQTQNIRYKRQHKTDDIINKF